MQDRVETSELHLAKSHGLNISDQDKSNAMALQVGTCLVCTTKHYYQHKAGHTVGYDVPSDKFFG